MNPIKQIITGVNYHTKRVLTASARSGVRLLGFDPLSREQTKEFLAPYTVATVSGGSIVLPAVFDAVDQTKLLFPESEASTEPTNVWQYKRGAESVNLLPNGLVQVGRQVLNTDYWSRDLMKDVFNRRDRQQRTVETLVAPFGHYFDGDVFVGYYDFMFLVAAKLCRIRASLPDTAFADAVVSYPLMHTAYEREVLALLGFEPDRVYDSRDTTFQFDNCLLGNHENWAYQTIGDIQTLKNQIEALLPIERTAQNRIYVSRSDRRRVLNEDALIQLLEQYDFQIIEDRPRTVFEHRSIYQNASFIMGPHGASFANIIWCEPGTHLFELFSPRFITDCFRYIAQVQGLTYSAYCDGPIYPCETRFIGQDITVSIPKLARYLDTVFAE